MLAQGRQLCVRGNTSNHNHSKAVSSSPVTRPKYILVLSVMDGSRAMAISSAEDSPPRPQGDQDPQGGDQASESDAGVQANKTYTEVEEMKIKIQLLEDHIIAGKEMEDKLNQIEAMHISASVG